MYVRRFGSSSAASTSPSGRLSNAVTVGAKRVIVSLIKILYRPAEFTNLQSVSNSGVVQMTSANKRTIKKKTNTIDDDDDEMQEQ